MAPDGKGAKDFQLTKHNVEELGHETAPRISDDAILRVIAEEEPRIIEVFRRARMLAKHAGRKTVMEEDIRLVYSFMEDGEP